MTVYWGDCNRFVVDDNVKRNSGEIGNKWNQTLI